MSYHRPSPINDEERHHVEIATLSLPIAAAGTGVTSGDGTTFVLEGKSSIIEQLVDNNNNNNESSQQQQKQPCIEGVVDLEVVSNLVQGITEEEFVGLLHHEVPQHTHHEHMETLLEETTSQEQEDEEEGQPTLETQSLLHGTPNIAVSLSADPFIHTLSGVNHHPADKNNDTKLGEKGEDVTIVGTIGATDVSGNDFRSSFLHGSHHIESGATMAREAFLLSIPAKGAGDSNYSAVSSISGGDKFVLALPEMVGQHPHEGHHHAKPIVGSFLRQSVSSTVAEVKTEMEHVFDPLPTDVQNVDLRVSIVPVTTKTDEYHEEVHLDVVVDRKVPVIGYVILLAGLLALSSIGAALDLQQGGVTPEMKIFWRLNSTSILFFVLAAKKINREEFAKFSWQELFIELPFAAANYAAMNTTFAVSLEMTSLVNAFILSNMASLLMILAKFGLGIPVLLFEGLGALIGFAGALICAAAGGSEDETSDGGDYRRLQNENLEILGNAIAFSASFTTAIYLTVAKRLRPKVDLVLFMFLIFTLASVFLLLYIVFVSGLDYEFSFDSKKGVFGWVNLSFDRLPLELYVAIICNGVGTMGYIAIMKYFDAVVVSMVMLTEPIVAMLEGMAVGVSTPPGWVTWAGDAVVMVGSIMVIWSGSRSTETIDATDALQDMENEVVDPKGMKNSLMRSPRLMKSPLIVSNQNGAEEMEFVSVGRKTQMQSTATDATQTIIWSSLKM